MKLPRLCVYVLARLWDNLSAANAIPGDDGPERLVFGTRNGTKMSAGNVRREFRRVIKRAGLDEAEWTPREMRHSFVSVLSANGVAVEHISRLVGHKGTAVTETVYRLQIQPVMEEGATAMDRIFPGAGGGAQSGS
ncbi:tyrosine-type recombinase/integrase [Actinomadura rudentiformis]|uniref:tyrosine-type recombinase/integrase n=1 Tax=Actinomadura rudentiformis TaxID=359158 RepID=UPI001CEF6C34